MAIEIPAPQVSLRCPHCLVTVYVSWEHTVITHEKPNGQWIVASTKCPACHEVILHLRLQTIVSVGGYLRPEETLMDLLVWPKGVARTPVPPQVPPDVAEDYIEACRVLPDSLKASAALSRRCLQNLLVKNAGVKKRDLKDQIQEVIDSRTLPTRLADDLHAVRVIGNFAAHPIKSTGTGEIVPVEPGEPEWNLDVVEALFDFYYVEPDRQRKRREALNDKLTKAGKPPLE